MIDQQILLIFDNFLRFSIYRLSYSALFMSTTVCYQHAVDMNLCSNFVIHFAVFSYHMYWLIYSGSHFLLHISSLGFAVIYFELACTPYNGFFQSFCSSISGIFHISFYDILLQIFCISVVPILFVIHMYYTQMVYLYFWQLHNMCIHR